MSRQIKGLSIKHIMNAISEDRRITIRPPILRTAEGNYTLIGREYLSNNSSREVCSTFSEPEHRKLIVLANNYKNHKEEA